MADPPEPSGPEPEASNADAVERIATNSFGALLMRQVQGRSSQEVPKSAVGLNGPPGEPTEASEARPSLDTSLKHGDARDGRESAEPPSQVAYFQYGQQQVAITVEVPIEHPHAEKTASLAQLFGQDNEDPRPQSTDTRSNASFHGPSALMSATAPSPPLSRHTRSPLTRPSHDARTPPREKLVVTGDAGAKEVPGTGDPSGHRAPRNAQETASFLPQVLWAGSNTPGTPAPMSPRRKQSMAPADMGMALAEAAEVTAEDSAAGGGGDAEIPDNPDAPFAAETTMLEVLDALDAIALRFDAIERDPRLLKSTEPPLPLRPPVVLPKVEERQKPKPIRRVEDLGIPSELIEAEDPWRLPRPLNFDPAAVHAAAASQWLRGGFDWQLHAYMLDRLTTPDMVGMVLALFWAVHAAHFYARSDAHAGSAAQRACFRAFVHLYAWRLLGFVDRAQAPTVKERYVEDSLAQCLANSTVEFFRTAFPLSQHRFNKQFAEAIARQVAAWMSGGLPQHTHPVLPPSGATTGRPASAHAPRDGLIAAPVAPAVAAPQPRAGAGRNADAHTVPPRAHQLPHPGAEAAVPNAAHSGSPRPTLASPSRRSVLDIPGAHGAAVRVRPSTRRHVEAHPPPVPFSRQPAADLAATAGAAAGRSAPPTVQASGSSIALAPPGLNMGLHGPSNFSEVFGKAPGGAHAGSSHAGLRQEGAGGASQAMSRVLGQGADASAHDRPPVISLNELLGLPPKPPRGSEGPDGVPGVGTGGRGVERAAPASGHRPASAAPSAASEVSSGLAEAHPGFALLREVLGRRRQREQGAAAAQAHAEAEAEAQRLREAEEQTLRGSQAAGPSSQTKTFQGQGMWAKKKWGKVLGRGKGAGASPESSRDRLSSVGNEDSARALGVGVADVWLTKLPAQAGGERKAEETGPVVEEGTAGADGAGRVGVVPGVAPASQRTGDGAEGGVGDGEGAGTEDDREGGAGAGAVAATGVAAAGAGASKGPGVLGAQMGMGGGVGGLAAKASGGAGKATSGAVSPEGAVGRMQEGGQVASPGPRESDGLAGEGPRSSEGAGVEGEGDTGVGLERTDRARRIMEAFLGIIGERSGATVGGEGAEGGGEGEGEAGDVAYDGSFGLEAVAGAVGGGALFRHTHPSPALAAFLREKGAADPEMALAAGLRKRTVGSTHRHVKAARRVEDLRAEAKRQLGEGGVPDRVDLVKVARGLVAEAGAVVREHRAAMKKEMEALRELEKRGIAESREMEAALEKVRQSKRAAAAAYDSAVASPIPGTGGVTVADIHALSKGPPVPHRGGAAGGAASPHRTRIDRYALRNGPKRPTLLMRDRLEKEIRQSGVVVGGPMGTFDTDTFDLAATTLAVMQREERQPRIKPGEGYHRYKAGTAMAATGKQFRMIVSSFQGLGQ